MIRNLIVNKTMDSVNKHCEVDDIKFEEIKYGIDLLYLSFTKTIIILCIAFALGIFKEIILLLIFYRLLRITGSGVHTMKSWHCWLSSLIIFLGTPFIIKYFSIPTNIMIFISLICSVLIFIYAPADTEKRPIINMKKRKIYKITCTITSILYVIGIYFIPNTLIQLTLMFSIVIETFMILPFSYKIFGAKYNNYKTYLANS